MEPELFSLARRMLHSFERQSRAEDVRAGVSDPAPFSHWTDLESDDRRCWLAAAIVARPDLAEGLTVEKGHWASGVLEVKR